MALSAKRILLNSLKILVGMYVLICGILYFKQEKIIFSPTRLSQDYKFTFNQPFSEVNIAAPDNEQLNGVLFKSDSTKGLIFYLHGNSGSIANQGNIAKRYIDLNYDVFMLDYPGYGKSSGKIKSEEQLFTDVQLAYDEMKKRYDESKIVVLGYSIGTGMATKVASTNHPRLLILEAPYYNLTDMMKRRYPLIPTFLLKYKLNSSEYLKRCKMPLVIFHGTEDEVVYYGSSLKLRKEFKPGDTLITLQQQGHDGISDNATYLSALAAILK